MKTKNVTEKNMKVCLVGSSGGHLTHLYLGEIITNYDQIVASMGHGMSSNNAGFCAQFEKIVDGILR